MPNTTDSTFTNITFYDSTATNTGIMTDSTATTGTMAHDSAGVIFTDSTASESSMINDSATSNIKFHDSASISDLLNNDILNTLANSPEFVAELKEMLVLNTALLKAFEALKAAFENNLNFTQEHAQKLSDISTRFEADFANFKLENAETNTRIDAYLLDLQTLMQESRQNLASATEANTIATQNIQSLQDILNKIDDIGALEIKVNAIVDVMNADENALIQRFQAALQDTQDSVQTLISDSITNLETTKTQLQDEMQAIKTSAQDTIQELHDNTQSAVQNALKEFQEEISNEASVQGIMEKLEQLKTQIETFAQEMLARQAQNGMGSIDNVSSPAHLFAKIETFAQKMLARQAQSALGTPPQAG